MATQHMSTKRIETIIEQLENCKEYSNGYSARCPAHNDTDNSLMAWIDARGNLGLKCFVGCERKAICTALGIAEQDLYQPSAGNIHLVKTITAFDLGVNKGIHPNMLASVGVIDGQETFVKNGKSYTVKGVVIPYYTMDGKPCARRRLRTTFIAKDGTKWNDDSSEPIIPYGLQRVHTARAAGYQIIVEGESDCWTLWQHGYPAMGIPGSTLHGCIQTEHMNGIAAAYIIQEPDDAGKKFAANIRNRLKIIGFTGKVYSIDFKAACGVKDVNELHQRNPKDFATTFDAARNACMVDAKSLLLANATYAEDLLAKVIPPKKWVVRELLPEGVIILAGAPKKGKSWLVFQIAIALVSNGKVLQEIAVEQGPVLYLSLEDTELRLQSRAEQLLGEQHLTPKMLGLIWNCPRLDEGGKEILETWLEIHPDTRMIIIDTWEKFRPSHTANGNIYKEDYSDIGILKELSARYKCAIVIVHHIRKPSKGRVTDPFEEISGSTGLTGAADGMLLLERRGFDLDATLHVTGRDIESKALPVSFDDFYGTWKLEDASTFKLSSEQLGILQSIEMLEAQGIDATPKAIADDLIQPANRVRVMLYKMKGNGLVRAVNGIYSRVKDDIYDGVKSANGANGANCTNPINGANDAINFGCYDGDKPTSEASSQQNIGEEKSNNIAHDALFIDNLQGANATKPTSEAGLQQSICDINGINSISTISRYPSTPENPNPIPQTVLKKPDTLPHWLNPELPEWEQELSKRVPGKTKRWQLVDLDDRRIAWYREQNKPVKRLPSKWYDKVKMARALEGVKDKMGY